MSITDCFSDWNAIELKAQTAELTHIETPKVPPATIEQQLLWATQRCAELQARVYRLQGKANEGLLWLGMGELDRAKQAIAQGFMNSATLQRLADKIANIRCEPTDKTICDIADTLAQLIDEVQRIDHIACSASDKATAAHELVNKLSA